MMSDLRKKEQWAWVRQTSASVMKPFDVYAQLASTEDFIPFDFSETGIENVASVLHLGEEQYYDLQGRRIADLSNVAKGQFVIVRTSDGTVRKVMVK